MKKAEKSANHSSFFKFFKVKNFTEAALKELVATKLGQCILVANLNIFGCKFSNDVRFGAIISFISKFKEFIQ